MCGWETLLLSALFGGSALLGAKKPKAPPPPPPAENPATPAPTAREGGATVRVGTDKPAKDTEVSPDYIPFIEKRSSGKALGGLGRSGLGL